MDTELAYAGKQQAAGYGLLRNEAKSPEPPRTLDSVFDASNRIRSIRRAVERMNDRFLPTPCGAEQEVTNGTLGRPPYAQAIERLHAEISELEAVVDQLSKHV